MTRRISGTLPPASCPFNPDLDQRRYARALFACYRFTFTHCREVSTANKVRSVRQLYLRQFNPTNRPVWINGRNGKLALMTLDDHPANS